MNFARVLTVTVAAAFMWLAAAAPASSQVTATDSIYFIVTDRFDDGDPENNYSVRLNDAAAYHGGDFVGIIRRLDYIRDMGFTAIWISPVIDNQRGGYHGYWPRDFYRVEEHFGDMETLRRLVREAHRREIKVIVDLVVNHTAVLHPWAADSAYQDWFNPRHPLVQAQTQEEVERFWLAGLPDLNHDNPDVRDYLIRMALWWIRETGIDGYRLDTVKHVPASFWREFSTAIHSEFPDFFLLGEVFDGNADYVGAYQGTGINGLIDFPMYFPVRSMLTGDGTGHDVARAIRSAQAYPDPSAMGTFIDNHDVARFLHNEREFRAEKLRQGLLYLFTHTGIPVMYYGTEIPLEGGSDHGNRADMVWDRPGSFVQEVARLNDLRTTHPALTSGTMDVLGSGDEWVAYGRRSGTQVLVTVLNRSRDETTLRVPLPDRWDAYRSGRDLFSGRRYTVRRDELRLELPAYTGALVELTTERYGVFRRLFD